MIEWWVEVIEKQTLQNFPHIFTKSRPQNLSFWLQKSIKPIDLKVYSLRKVVVYWAQLPIKWHPAPFHVLEAMCSWADLVYGSAHSLGSVNGEAWWLGQTLKFFWAYTQDGQQGKCEEHLPEFDRKCIWFRTVDCTLKSYTHMYYMRDKEMTLTFYFPITHLTKVSYKKYFSCHKWP